MLSFTPLHPTFGAEVHGADLATISDAGLDEIKHAIGKYGFLVFRATGLDDDSHVAFSRRLGDLDDIGRYLTPGRKLRYRHIELFDAGNVDEHGRLLHPDSARAHQAKGNGLFHVDSSFNPRRASYSLLRAVVLPPAADNEAEDNGGPTTTDFADARAAYDTLPPDLQADLRAHDYVGTHAIAHSRKLADPAFYRDLNVDAQPHMRHRILQRQDPFDDNDGDDDGGRDSHWTLYVGAHLHYLEGVPRAASDALIARLNAHATHPSRTVSVPWHQPGDLVMWDNRVVLHRAGAGAFAGRHVRDLRRTTVHDAGAGAWGLNGAGTAMPGFHYDPAQPAAATPAVAPTVAVSS
ncbi:Taurine catabolism dioxygenase TauD/TfdA [Niveomyces insectorum RCEF 264]|uniref:Taurine catabolism dioxygenase TauD/TfdA n=1 Tax=Niveomyces insectorum RCEF 264 TaxID=1081102 RepID=A0A167QT85_9HYPO|nr:Taurine catabolism dioxygenase TauD/TfdA [Niveomyces insectorum RCEF 264]